MNAKSIFPKRRTDTLGLLALVVEIAAVVTAETIRSAIDWAWDE